MRHGSLHPHDFRAPGQVVSYVELDATGGAALAVVVMAAAAARVWGSSTTNITGDYLKLLWRGKWRQIKTR